jgi:hypothetical protein
VQARHLAPAVLLGAVALSCANGFINGVVAYERDTTVFYYPLLVWASQQLRAGQFPLWCPQILAGYPLLADGELGLAAPPVLLALLSLPADVAFVVLRLFHLAVAALGAYLLARAWRLPRAAAALAGITFALGSFLQAHIHHENIVRTAAWLPLTLACIERALRTTGPARRRWILGGAATIGLAGVGLHPEVLLINLLTLGGYGLLRCALGTIAGSRRRYGLVRAWPIAAAAASAALGLALAAVQLVPLAELAPLSARTGTFPYSEVAGQSLTPPGLVQLVFPYAFRAPGNVEWGLWTHWESYFYVGLAPLVLALVALTRLRRPGIALWVLLGGGGLIVALGQYSPLDLFALLWRVPGLGWLRAPGRFELVSVLALAMLAAHGLALLQAGARVPVARLPRAVRWSLLPAALLVPATLAVLLERLHQALLAARDPSLHLVETQYLALPHQNQPLSAGDVYQGLLWATDLGNPRVAGALLGLLAVGAVVATWQTAPWSRARRWAGWPALLVLAAAADLLVFGWGIHPRQALSVLATPDPAVAAVRQLLPEADAADGPVRVLASPVVQQVAPDRLVPLGLQEAGGYASLDTSRQRAYLLRVQRVDDELLDLWNVRYLLDPSGHGDVASYAGVDYFARNPLLEGPARSDLGDEFFSLPSGFEPVEIRLISALVGGGELSQGEPVGAITLRSASGDVLADWRLRAGIEAMDWGWDDLARGAAVRHDRVELAGEVSDKLPEGGVARRLLSFARTGLARPVAADTLEIQSLAGRGELVVYGVALVDGAGQVQQLFGRHKSKYREVRRDQYVAVLENTAAFPRAFLVPRARVAPPGAALEQMEDQPFAPREEVILGADTPPTTLTPLVMRAPGRAAPAPPGQARIERYAAREVTVQVASPAPAFLVVTDAFYPGWHAYLDGGEQPVLRGDFAFRAVEVPAGSHQIVFRFEPGSVLVGLAVSLGTLVLCVVASLMGSQVRVWGRAGK